MPCTQRIGRRLKAHCAKGALCCFLLARQVFERKLASNSQVPALSRLIFIRHWVEATKRVFCSGMLVAAHAFPAAALSIQIFFVLAGSVFEVPPGVSFLRRGALAGA